MTQSPPRPLDLELFSQDMQVFAEIAAAFTDSAGREVVLQLKATFEAIMALGRRADACTNEANALHAAGKQNDPRLQEIKAELQAVVSEVETLESKTIPDLLRRLQEAAPTEELKAKLSQMTDTVNRREVGIAVAGEEQPVEAGPGGGDLWSD